MDTWGRRHRNPLALYQYCMSYVTIIDVLLFSPLIAGFVVVCDSTSIASEIDEKKRNYSFQLFASGKYYNELHIKGRKIMLAEAMTIKI